MRLSRALRTSVLLAALAGTPLLAAMPGTASAQVAVSITVAPPVLPVYVQPPVPAPGYLWAPGYWAYADTGYYWVPGAWVLPPQPGLLWTPAYWGWSGGVYLFHAGYWGPHVGFYGGINYGFGYDGVGFVGGRWDHGVFAYNRAVANVNVNIVHNVYRENVHVNVVNRVSFNGGTGGIAARPTPEQEAFGREAHMAPTGPQAQHQVAAAGNRAQFAAVNHGRPGVAASPRPGVFAGHGVVAAHAGPGPRAVGPHPGGPRAAGPHPVAGRPGGVHGPAARPHAPAPHGGGDRDHHR